MGKSMNEHPGHIDHHQHGHGAAAETGAIDPVCGMTVRAAPETRHTDFNGVRYYFCSARCQQTFTADPARYIKPAAAATQPKAEIPPGTKWTCPMHPEIIRDAPGACPICGMALEPMIPAAASGPNPERLDMQRRFWIGAALTLPILALAMIGEMLGLTRMLGATLSNWLQLLLATPVVWWAGWPFFERGARSLVTRQLNMFTLIALGTGTAWIYSVVATTAPALFPPAFRSADGGVDVYFEAAAVITVLVLLGQVLELTGA